MNPLSQFVSGGTLRDFFTEEAGQQRRAWLERQGQAIGDAAQYYLGPTGIPTRLGAAAELLNFTDAGDVVAAGEASQALWNDPSVANAANYAAAGAAMALPFYSARMGEGLASAADDAVRYFVDEDGAVSVAAPLADSVEARGAQIMDLLRSGRGTEVTDEMLDMGDPTLNARLNDYLFRNYDLPMGEASRMQRAREMGFRPEMYHGTDAQVDFSSFAPNTFLTEDVDEANAYSFVSDLARREKGMGKYSVTSGRELPTRMEYYGTLSDIDAPSPGFSYATDSGVFTYEGGGKWVGHSDYGVDYGAFDEADSTIGVRPGLPNETQRFAAEYDERVANAFPGGDGARVFPVMTAPRAAQDAPALVANRLGLRLGGDTSVLSQYPGADVLDTYSDEGWVVGKPIRQQVVLDPSVARSRFARFDPRLAHLRNLSAGLAAIGILGSYGGGVTEDDRNAMQAYLDGL